jgi:alkylation response protein AidB-like acyl-CoA dehydrogenase
MDFTVPHDDVVAAEAIAAVAADAVRALTTPTTPWLQRSLVLEAVARRSTSAAVVLQARAQAAHVALLDDDTGCLVLLGAAGGIEHARPEVVARRTADGVVVDGNSAVIVNGALATFAVVRTMIDNRDAIVVVDLRHAGVSRAAVNALGLRDAQQARLTFSAVPARLLDAEPVLSLLQRWRIDLASIALGLADAAFETARTWSLTHVAAGKPLARQQAVHFKLANMKVELDGARLLTRQAAWRQAHGEDVVTLAALTKVNATEATLRITDLAMQVLGDEASDTANVVEGLLRDARALAALGGSNDHLREQVAIEMLD